jgi:hypothetical protein
MHILANSTSNLRSTELGREFREVRYQFTCSCGDAVFSYGMQRSVYVALPFSDQVI